MPTGSPGSSSTSPKPAPDPRTEGEQPRCLTQVTTQTNGHEHPRPPAGPSPAWPATAAPSSPPARCIPRFRHHRPRPGPLAGARSARDIELGSRHAAREYIRAAREAGHGWDEIGQALGLAPGGDADQEGLTVAEAAYTYAAGRPDTEAPWRPRSFTWRCRSCEQAISDRGLIAGPADDELGHAEDCPRLAAAVADWDASWEAEP